MYRSPSQSSIEFGSFLSGFEDMLSSVLFSKSQFTVILGDFNARSSTWWSNDITNINGTLIDSLTTTHGFKQLISDATHILPQLTFCIDLIFTDQGTHPLWIKTVITKSQSESWISKLSIHLHISILSGILKNLIMMQLKELLNLWIGILSFNIKMYMNKLLFSTKH